MTIVQQELAEFKAKLITSLAALITTPKQKFVGKDLIDLFEDRLHVPGKRPLEGADTNVAQKKQRTTDVDTEL